MPLSKRDILIKLFVKKVSFSRDICKVAIYSLLSSSDNPVSVSYTHLDVYKRQVHNHFVVNSVSFKTGRKFENHISDHYHLREISDAVCLEHGKGILKDTEFYGGCKKEYWRKQNGGLSHRELLKADIDAALAQSASLSLIHI